MVIMLVLLLKPMVQEIPHLQDGIIIIVQLLMIMISITLLQQFDMSSGEIKVYYDYELVSTVNIDGGAINPGGSYSNRIWSNPNEF